MRRLALLALLASPVLCQELPVGERWYVASLNGTPVGSIRTRLEPVEVEDAPGWRYTFDLRIEMALESGKSSMRDSSELFCRADLTPVLRTSREDDNGEVRTKVIRFETDRVVEEQDFMGRRTTIEVPVTGPVVEEAEMVLFAAAREGRLRAGERFEYVKVSTEHRRTHRESLTVVEAVPLGGEGGGWRIRIEDELQPGVEVEMVVEGRGRIVEGRIGPIVFRPSTEEEARRLSAGEVAVPTTIPVSLQVAPEHLDALRSIVVEVVLASDADVEFRTDPYQEVLAREGRRHRLRLRPNRPEPSPGVAVPIDDPALARFLLETDQYQSGAPEIAARSREIVNSETDPTKAAGLLGVWVYDNLEKLSNASALSAVETLRQRKGDCTEHAALFVGLARAAGLPSRTMSGLLFTGDAFGRHAWSEAWIGSWLPVDAAWGRIGTPPLYLSFGPESDAEGVSQGEALEMALIAGFEIRIVSLDLGGQLFDASDPASLWQAPEESEAVREVVVLRSGLSFQGELAGVEEGRLVYRTPYGLTLLARSDVERIEFLAPSPPYSFRSVPTGLALRFVGADWRPDPQAAEKNGFLCYLNSSDPDAIGIVRTDRYRGDLDGYLQAVRKVVKGALPEGDEVERLEIGQGARKTPAILWRVTARSGNLVLRYQQILWQWRGKSCRVVFWTAQEDFERLRPAIEATIRSIELLED